MRAECLDINVLHEGLSLRGKREDSHRAPVDGSQLRLVQRLTELLLYKLVEDKGPDRQTNTPPEDSSLGNSPLSDGEIDTTGFHRGHHGHSRKDKPHAKAVQSCQAQKEGNGAGARCGTVNEAETEALECTAADGGEGREVVLLVDNASGKRAKGSRTEHR